MSDGNQVARALENWAVKEMGFRNTQNKDGIDTNKSFDLSGICLGPMADIWIYVMKHIKSESTVQVIKGNLRLNSKEQTDDPKKLTLISQRDKLRQEIAELRKTTSVLHESLIESKTTTQEKEQELRKQQLAFRDFKRSSVILGSVKNNVEDSVKLFNQTTREVKKHLQSLAPEIGNEADLERYKIDIENMCKLMQNSLNELLKEEPNIEKINGTKMAVGNHLATLLETLPHPLFMKLIQEQQAAEISSRNQKEFTTAPTQNDTALDFIPDNVEPLQKLLCDLSWTYTDTQTRAKNAKEKTEALKKELAEVKAEILQTLNTRFDGEDTKLAAAHLKQVETEIQVARQKGAIDGLRKILEELENFCTCYEARQADIEQKIVTIEGNSRLSDHLTAIICTLARKRANNPNLVQQLANQSLRMVNDDLVAIHNMLNKTIQASKGNIIEKELELFQQLKPSQLFNSNVDKKLIPVHRLAMNRLLLTTESGVSGNQIEMTLKCLGLPQTMPVLHVMKAVGDKQLQIRKMQQTLKWHKSRKSEIMEKHGLVWLENGLVRYKELSKKLEDNWNAQEVAMLPSLELRRKRMDEALKYIQDVEVALQEWCDEPAKLIDTGRVVSGKSLEQWSAEWKKSIALCRSKV